MSPDKMIAVLAAYQSGMQIQYARIKAPSLVFKSCLGVPAWDFSTYIYRAKPEPIECWANIYPDGETTNYYASENEATQDAGIGSVRVAVHMKEVI